MIRPSILVTVQDGKPVATVVSNDADEALNAYKDSTDECYLFIRPDATKRKNALKSPAPVKVTPKKSGSK